MAFKRAHLSPNTRAYTKAHFVTLEVVVGIHEQGEQDFEPEEHEHGFKPIWLKVQTGKMRAFIWLSLTSMTTEELDAFKHVVDLAYEDAREVTLALDAAALKTMEQVDLTDVPMRALASAPPTYERKISLAYEPKRETRQEAEGL